MDDQIEKTIELKASVARVWRALTDSKEFGLWFGVILDGPFVQGETIRGKTNCPGYEGMKWEATVIAMEPERRFAFMWCPYEHDDGRDFTSAPKTTVEFRIQPIGSGTRLILSESGFSFLPDDVRRLHSMRTNTEGWIVQLRSLASHVEQ